MTSMRSRSAPSTDKSKSLAVTITYLEQRRRPDLVQPPRPPGKLALMRSETPPLHFYRYLYNAVGEPWKWVSRRRLDDDALREIIHDPAVHIYVLYIDGAPGGFAEIDLRIEKLSEIRFFGLTPEFSGRGFGRYFLTNVIDLAWSFNPRKVRLETCSLDHPAALPLYQKLGFRVYDRRDGIVELDA